MLEPTVRSAIWDYIERQNEDEEAISFIGSMFDYMSEAQLIEWFYEAVCECDEDQICHELGESLGTELIDLYNEKKGNSNA